MPNTRTIYIAAASTEAPDVAVLADRLVRVGWVITHRWWTSFLTGAHVAGADMAVEQPTRLAHAEEDISAVLRASVLWLLVPRRTSVGAWVEFGAALAHARSATDKRVIISGEWRGTIFAELAWARFDTHAQAVSCLTTRLA
jgi:hypothetical protein